MTSGYHYHCQICGEEMWFSAGHDAWLCEACGTTWATEDLLEIMGIDEIGEDHEED